MGSAALRGLGRILKGRVKPKGKSSYPATKPRGKGAYPTKPSEALGIKQPKGILGSLPKTTKAPKKPGFKTGVALGAAAALAAKGVDDSMKKAKAEDKKLKKAIEKHKKKTKEKREKHGKPHA